jgi:hypothetical protein
MPIAQPLLRFGVAGAGAGRGGPNQLLATLRAPLDSTSPTSEREFKTSGMRPAAAAAWRSLLALLLALPAPLPAAGPKAAEASAPVPLRRDAAAALQRHRAALMLDPQDTGALAGLASVLDAAVECSSDPNASSSSADTSAATLLSHANAELGLWDGDWSGALRHACARAPCAPLRALRCARSALLRGGTFSHGEWRTTVRTSNQLSLPWLQVRMCSRARQRPATGPAAGAPSCRGGPKQQPAFCRRKFGQQKPRCAAPHQNQIVFRRGSTRSHRQIRRSHSRFRRRFHSRF